MSRFPAYILTIVTIIASSHAVSGTEHGHPLTAGGRLTVNSTGEMIIAGNRMLQFFDKTGKLKKSRKLRGNESVDLPEHGRAVGIIRYNDNSPTTLRPVAFELYDIDGQRLYTISKPKFTSAIVSPSGSVVVGIDGVKGLPESTLRFVDNAGKQIAAVHADNVRGGRFSYDGSTVFLSTAKDSIFSYSASAQPLNRFGRGTLFDCSADGTILAAWQKDSVRVYSSGKLVNSVPTAAPVKAVKVSADGRFFGWAEMSRAVIRGIDSDTAIAEYILSTPGEHYRSLAFGEKGEQLALCVHIDPDPNAESEQHAQGRIEVVTVGGQQIKLIPISYTNSDTNTPRVRFVQNDTVVVAITLDEIRFFDVLDSRSEE